MKRSTIDDMIHRLSLIKLEDEDEDEASSFEEDDGYWVVKSPNPATSQSRVEICESEMQRNFPKEYREFLLLHDGWVDLQNEVTLLGTSDYENPEMQSYLGGLILAQLNGLDAPIEGISPADLAPDILYPALYNRQNCPAKLINVVRFIQDFEETETIMLIAKSTIFGLADAKLFCFRDNEVLEDVASGGVIKRHKSFWTWMNYYSEWRVWRSDE